MQDGHIPLIVASQAFSGAELKELVDKIDGGKPSQLDVTPIVLKLLLTPIPGAPPTLPVTAPTGAVESSPAAAPIASPAAVSSAAAAAVSSPGAAPSATPAAKPQ
jgi:hypothetical protein